LNSSAFLEGRDGTTTRHCKRGWEDDGKEKTKRANDIEVTHVCETLLDPD